MTATLEEPQVGFWSVGSLPPDLNPEKDVASPEDVQEFLAKYLGDCPLNATGGEVRPEQQVWIVGYSNKLAQAAGVEGLEDYSSEPWHFTVRVLKGLVSDRHMTSAKVPPIGISSWAIDDYAAFKKQKHKNAIFTVELASPVAYRMFSGALYTDTQLLEDKIVEEIWAIYNELGPEEFSRLNFQISVPFELWADAMLPESMEAREAHYIQRLEPVQRIIRRSPVGTKFSFHVCWGDLGGKPAVHPRRQKVGTKIAMVNAINSLPVWDEVNEDGTSKWILFAIHDPFGDGKHAPRRLTEAEFEEYTTSLRPLREGTRYAFGILHNLYTDEQLPGMIDDVQRLMNILRSKGVTVFYLSTHCGLGRKTVREAIKIFQQFHYVRSQLDLAA